MKKIWNNCLQKIKFIIPLADSISNKGQSRKTKTIDSVLILILVLAASWFFDWNPSTGLITTYLGLIWLWNLSGRTSAWLALLFLTSVPVALILKNDKLADILALSAYYFLAITVIGEIIALKKNDE